MIAMWSFYLVPTVVLLLQFVSITVQMAVTLEERLDMLEIQVRLEEQRRRQDIKSLRTTLRDIGATKRTSIDAGVSEQIAKRIDEMENEVKNFIKEITVRFTALTKGLSDEKIIGGRNTAVLRNALKKQHEEIEVQGKTIQSFEGMVKNETTLREIQKDEVLEIIKELNSSFHKWMARLVIDGDFRSKELFPKCSDGWFEYANKCYLYVNDKVDWHTASIGCFQHGAKLAEPDDRKTLDKLSELVGSNVWVGGTDEAEEGVWVWSGSNKNIQSLMWDSGQPNSFGGGQDCMEIHKHAFNDEGCSVRNKYVCEKSLTNNN